MGWDKFHRQTYFKGPVTIVGSTTIGTTTNGIVLSSQGFTFVGSATVWDDLRYIPSAMDFPGVSDPAIGDWQPGGSGQTYKVWCFDTGDIGFFTVQLPHGYKTGSNILVHTHWTPRGLTAADSGSSVAWRLSYSWANRNEAFPASSVASMTQVYSGGNDLHLMTPDVTIPGSGKTISSILECAIFRSGVGGADTWAGTGAAGAPALLEVDFHVELDTLGSNQSGIK